MRNLHPFVSVIIPVRNERKRIAEVIRNARRVHPRTEVIVVANGTTDGSDLIAEKLGARVIDWPYALGHDVGRSVGAMMARGEILLFLDGDLPIPTRLLRPFVRAVMEGADLALNGASIKKKRERIHPVLLSKYALNIMLGRADLQGASLTTVPHALNRHALQVIGREHLSVPPKAHAMAVMKGLTIRTPIALPVVRWNRKRRRGLWMRKLVIGDHMEAISWILEERGERGGYTDGLRCREVQLKESDLDSLDSENQSEEIEPSCVVEVSSSEVNRPAAFAPSTPSVAAILSVMNEAETLPSVLSQLSRLPLDEVIVVINGSTDESLNIARNAPFVKVLEYEEALGHDVGRSIGAAAARSDILLFLDADFVVPAESLLPFIFAVANGADIALNDLTPYFPPISRRDQVTILKEWMNRVMGRDDLHANSLTAVPHAMSRKALSEIGVENLMVPPKAHAIALWKGLRVVAPASVDVISKNRLRKENTGIRNDVKDLIIGDHLQALHTLMQWKGERLGFEDNCRKRFPLPIHNV